MTLHRIVCFVDLSSLSRAGARLARAVALRHKASLTLVCATDTPVYATSLGGEIAFVPPRITTAVERHHTRAARRRIKKLARDVCGGSATDVGWDVLARGNVDTLLEYADSHAADLIVVGADEPGFLQKLFHTGTPEKLARRAARPVLVLATETEVRPPLEHLLVATRFSERCRAAARVASDLVGKDGKLSFVHVWNQPPAFAASGQYSGPEDPSEQSPLQLSRAAHFEQLRRFVAGLPIRTTDIDLYLDIGEPSDQINRRADELSADAIVIGSHPHQSFRERLFGTIADRVIERAARPVLAVPSPVGPVKARTRSDTRVEDLAAASQSPLFPA